MAINETEDKNTIQRIALADDISANPFLPSHPIPSQTLKLTTSEKKSIIRSINELVKDGSNVSNVVEGFNERLHEIEQNLSSNTDPSNPDTPEINIEELIKGLHLESIQEKKLIDLDVNVVGEIRGLNKVFLYKSGGTKVLYLLDIVTHEIEEITTNNNFVNAVNAYVAPNSSVFYKAGKRIFLWAAQNCSEIVCYDLITKEKIVWNLSETFTSLSFAISQSFRSYMVGWSFPQKKGIIIYNREDDLFFKEFEIPSFTTTISGVYWKEYGDKLLFVKPNEDTIAVISNIKKDESLIIDFVSVESSTYVSFFSVNEAEGNSSNYALFRKYSDTLKYSYWYLLNLADNSLTLVEGLSSSTEFVTFYAHSTKNEICIMESFSNNNPIYNKLYKINLKEGTSSNIRDLFELPTVTVLTLLNKYFIMYSVHSFNCFYVWDSENSDHPIKYSFDDNDVFANMNNFGVSSIQQSNGVQSSVIFYSLEGKDYFYAYDETNLFTKIQLEEPFYTMMNSPLHQERIASSKTEDGKLKKIYFIDTINKTSVEVLPPINDLSYNGWYAYTLFDTREWYVKPNANKGGFVINKNFHIISPPDQEFVAISYSVIDKTVVFWKASTKEISIIDTVNETIRTSEVDLPNSTLPFTFSFHASFGNRAFFHNKEFVGFVDLKTLKTKTLISTNNEFDYQIMSIYMSPSQVILSDNMANSYFYILNLFPNQIRLKYKDQILSSIEAPEGGGGNSANTYTKEEIDEKFNSINSILEQI